MQADAQLVTLRLYGALCSLREDWGGALVVACGESATLAAAAVGIAGGVCLVLSEDAAAMKAALRRGELDFVVNTLDEALRTMKNEVRQKRALAVGCVGNVAAVLAEMVERGVQPEAGFCREAELERRGMRGLDVAGAERMCRDWVEARGWRELFVPKDEAQAQDADWLVRERWLRRGPQYLREATRVGRWVWVESPAAS